MRAAGAARLQPSRRGRRHKRHVQPGGDFYLCLPNRIYLTVSGSKVNTCLPWTAAFSLSECGTTTPATTGSSSSRPCLRQLTPTPRNHNTGHRSTITVKPKRSSGSIGCTITFAATGYSGCPIRSCPALPSRGFLRAWRCSLRAAAHCFMGLQPTRCRCRRLFNFSTTEDSRDGRCSRIGWSSHRQPTARY